MGEKIKAWNKEYINYDILIKDLDSIIEDNKADIIKQKELYDIFESKENEGDQSNKIISFNKLTLNFISKLDEELNKVHIFFTKKERELYEQINIQFKVYNNKNITEQKQMEIAKNLVKLAQLSRELKSYVYINVISLINILYKADHKLTDISYNYMQKHLTKSNGNFIYILNFKTVDESVVMIDEIFNSIKKNLKKSNYFKNNEEEKTKFNEYKNILKESLNDINNLHEKIFLELNQWEKYLNISLGLPTSSNNSIFKNTDLTGDSIFYSEKSSKGRKKKSLNIGKDDSEAILIESYNICFGVLFDPSDAFCYKTKDVLSNYNLDNIRFIYLLSGFYSYSYCFLIPDIMIYLLHNNGTDYFFFDSSFSLNLHLYAFCISIPLIGNIIAKYTLKKYIYKSYKKLLLFSLILIFMYYFLSFLGLIIMEIFARIDFRGKKEHRIKFDIILILIGRLLLGVSYLKQLCKVYIDIYIPITNQVQINNNITIISYAGYIIGLLFNCLHFFRWG